MLTSVGTGLHNPTHVRFSPYSALSHAHSLVSASRPPQAAASCHTPRMTADAMGTSVDPWSPGYVTPASTPSPRAARGQSGRDDSESGAPAESPSASPSTSPSTSPSASPSARPSAPELASHGIHPGVSPWEAKAGAPIAVSVRRADHVYVNFTFNGKTTVPVLSDFNMTVRQGNM